MSMVHPHAPAGVAGAGKTASGSGPAVHISATSRDVSSDNGMGRRVTHGLAALVCALGLLAMTGAGASTSTLAAPDTSTSGATGAGAPAQDGGGQSIADFALQFQGYPYVWAGNGPGGFDCSGFTQYVLLNTVGIDIGHDVAGQTGSGAWVEWDAWQPGDLVYFAGTYRVGVSHTGVYVGDGQFIHAENEGTGVVISSIYSEYYAGHYYGAYRHW